MPSAPDRSPTGRRMLSRISSPFANRTRNIDLSVEIDEPHKQRSPGDLVAGYVRVRVFKPARITHLVVCLHGFVQVYRNPGSPGEGFRAYHGYLGTGRGKKPGEYFGNGFASLFEDELVLCGDGRLAEGDYKFRFNDLEFPDCDLPSSIDFERGTITYMVTATLTRANTMSPSISCDRKVYFVERIDISPLYPPQPRTIILEPINKRSRARNTTKRFVDSSDRSHKAESARHSNDLQGDSEASSTRSTNADSNVPESPVQSETSHESKLSSHGQTSQPESQQRSSPRTSDTSKASQSKRPSGNKVITATIESQAGGCLRGDTIPIKVHISHTKHVKSLYGVIVTLYRLARVDMRPSIPLGPTEKGKSATYEEYYPKSFTGLGGLSLSGAGSTHVFQKDLAQVMVPLMIDPQALETEVNAKVRVPEEAFPTISTVPGAMISFKYYVEVIVDIQGKLSNQDRSIANLGGAPPARHFLNVDGSDAERPSFAPFGSTIVDTTPIRREKSVITCTFEVIVGTDHSERRKGKRKLETASEPVQSQPQPRQESTNQVPDAQLEYGWYDHDGYYYPNGYEPGHAYQHPESEQYHYHAAYQDRSYDRPPPVPLPQIQDETQMTEKERVQQAEQRLLPSQPPGIEDQPYDTSAGATAPYLSDYAVDTFETSHWHAASEHRVAPSSGSQASSAEAGRSDRPRQMSTVPEYEPPAGSSVTVANVTNDDKQEMQRQQLQAAASAPLADEDIGGDSPPTAQDLEAPSAPTLEEADGLLHDTNDSHADAPSSSGLPRYER